MKARRCSKSKKKIQGTAIKFFLFAMGTNNDDVSGCNRGKMTDHPLSHTQIIYQFHQFFSRVSFACTADGCARTRERTDLGAYHWH